MKPTIKGVMAEFPLKDSDAEALRCATNLFLMTQNDSSITGIARLSPEELDELARKFLDLHGSTHFDSLSRSRLKWPLDEEELVEKLTVIMWCQRRHKVQMLKKEISLAKDVSSTESDSDSEPIRRRKITPDRTFNPPGLLSGSSPTRHYSTRSAVQPGMPPIPSIEDDNGTSDNLCRRKKRRRMTMSNLENGSTEYCEIDIRSQSKAAFCLRPAKDAHKRNRIEVNVPARKHTPQSSNTNTTQTNEAITIHGETLDESANSDIAKRTPSMVNEQRLTSSWDDFDFDFDQFLNRDVEASQSQTTSLPSSQVKPTSSHATSHQPTPPASSAHGNDFVMVSVNSAHERSRRYQTTVEPESFRIIEEDEEDDLVELTATEQGTAKLDLGQNCFKVVEKKRAFKILQKLIDFHVEELKVCQRNAHQAPDIEMGRAYATRAKYLARSLQDMRDDESIWSGGSADDRTVAML